MTLDDINLIDSQDTSAKKYKTRKLKLKKLSHSNTYARWKKFRLSLYKKRLEQQQSKLMDMGFKDSQLRKGTTARERSEERVLRKTKAIAKLESKIRFLETGAYSTEEFIDNRAIKLKNIMMQNLRWHSGITYKISEEGKEELLAKEQPVEDSVTEIQSQIAADVQAIMSENATQSGSTPKVVEPTPESQDTITAPEVATAIQTELDKQKAGEPVVNFDDVQQTIGQEMSKITVQEPIRSEEVADAIQREMDKIKISSNGSSPAKVNKFVNEDGTYRLRRENIDEDFRVTRVNSKATSSIDEPAIVPEINIPPFQEVSRKVPIVESPKKAVTPIEYNKKPVFAEIPKPTIKTNSEYYIPTIQEENIAQDDKMRVLPVVVPERPAALESKDITAVSREDQSVITTTDTNALSALLERARVLQDAQNRINAERAAADQAAAQAQEEYESKYKMLSTYVEQLEDQCAEASKAIDQTKAQTQERQAEISAIDLIMVQSGIQAADVKGKRR